MAEGYGGLPGAYVFAFRRSRSLLFRTYAVASALLAAFVAIIIGLGVVTWIVRPIGLVGERALLMVVGILVFLPLVAPVLVVARRHRRTGSAPAADRLVGIAGYALVVAVWLGLVIAGPAGPVRPGPFRPAVALLYALPTAVAPLPPAAALAFLAYVVRLTRPTARGAAG